MSNPDRLGTSFGVDQLRAPRAGNPLKLVDLVQVRDDGRVALVVGRSTFLAKKLNEEPLAESQQSLGGSPEVARVPGPDRFQSHQSVEPIDIFISPVGSGSAGES